MDSDETILKTNIAVLESRITRLESKNARLREEIREHVNEKDFEIDPLRVICFQGAIDEESIRFYKNQLKRSEYELQLLEGGFFE